MHTSKIKHIATTAVFAVAAGAVALGMAGTAGAASGATYGDPEAAASIPLELMSVAVLASPANATPARMGVTISPCG